MRVFKKQKKLDVLIDRVFDSWGVKLSLKKHGNLVDVPIKFTISELKQLDNLDELQILEDLFADGIMCKINTGEYIISYDNVYELDQEQCDLLGVPSKTTPVSIELDNQGYVSGKEFKFIPKISSDKYKNLHKIGKRKGAIIELPTQGVLLLDRTYYHFLEMLEQQPNREDWEKLMTYVAQVKKEAKTLGVKLNTYIENEEYEFIDELDIELQRIEEGIEIIPEYTHDDLDENVLDEMAASGKSYLQNGKKRVFVNQDTLAAKEKVENIPKIEKKDIPKLIQNPNAFYNEDLGISLEDFSDRVKGLDIRVYKAQPYIHAKQNERGWFNYETGFKIRDDEGNDIFNNDETYFQGFQDDDFMQIDNDTFVEIPQKVNQFEDIASKVKEKTKNQQSTEPNLSNYILEIFENFTHVEYNKPLSDMKEELSKSQVFDSEPPNGFNAVLKPFQEEGFKWMKTLRATGNGGLLADDMGLGKTIQVIAYLLHLKEQNKLTPTLLVLPKTLIDNWINELHKFAPGLTNNIYKHVGPDRLKDYQQISSFDIILTTYHTMSRDQMILGRIDWEMVICDEAQAIKNPSTANSNVIKALKNNGRLALTGTPVENNLTELWSIIDFVQPGTLGSLKSFRDEYEKKLEDESSYLEIQHSIEEKIKYIYLRRTKVEELKDQLPNKVDYKIPVSIGRDQEKLYQDLINKVKEGKVSGLQAIQRLKMLSSHPGLLDDRLKDTNSKRIPKLLETIKIIKSIKEVNEKVIIFTEFRKMQVILRKEILMTFGIDASVINGTSGHRQSIVDEFNQKTGFDVLILSPKAAGTGLTITSANHVIHYTRWWNPAVENQATDRVYRIGQERDVHVYYPIVTGADNNKTVEEVIDELLEDKKALAENVIVPSKGESIEQEVLNQMKYNMSL